MSADPSRLAATGSCISQAKCRGGDSNSRRPKSPDCLLRNCIKQKRDLESGAFNRAPPPLQVKLETEGILGWRNICAREFCSAKPRPFDTVVLRNDLSTSRTRTVRLCRAKLESGTQTVPPSLRVKLEKKRYLRWRVFAAANRAAASAKGIRNRMPFAVAAPFALSFKPRPSVSPGALARSHQAPSPFS